MQHASLQLQNMIMHYCIISSFDLTFRSNFLQSITLSFNMSHTINQIMTVNFYLISMTFYTTNSIYSKSFYLQYNCTCSVTILHFQWKRCGKKVHFAIILLNLIKLAIVCIIFHATKGPLALLFKIFLSMLLCTNVCNISIETVYILCYLKKTSNIQQHEPTNA